MSQAFFLLSQLQVIVGPTIAAVEAGTLSNPGPWRPPEWTSQQITSITVPGTPASNGNQATPAQVLVFDAVLRVQHSRELRRTEHPVQTQPNSAIGMITDHAYLLPARVTLEIGMSDAMASYSENMWTGNRSKSVSAYQTLVALQASRSLVTLTTRLDTYPNMAIDSIQPTETEKTRHGLRASVALSQLSFANVPSSPNATSSASSSGGAAAAGASGTVGGYLMIGGESIDAGSQVVSSSPQTTGQTPLGQIQPGTVTNTLTDQNSVSGGDVQNLVPAVPGAGNWSSTNIGAISV